MAFPLLTAKQFRTKYNISNGTLCAWRNKGMPVLRLGKRCFRYPLVDILKWFEAQHGDILLVPSRLECAERSEDPENKNQVR